MATTTANNLAERLGYLLLNEGLSLVTAESCTGGGLAEVITRVPGSSQWFERGFVTYSNAAKHELLQVQEATLEEFGAVSEETAVEMVRGAVINSHAQVGVSITGIAGPSGGSAEKPVGTVCLAWQANEEIWSTRVVFEGEREDIRHQACLLAMQGLLDRLEK